MNPRDLIKLLASQVADDQREIVRDARNALTILAEAEAFNLVLVMAMLVELLLVLRVPDEDLSLFVSSSDLRRVRGGCHALDGLLGRIELGGLLEGLS